MKHIFLPSYDPRKSSDVVIIPFWEGAEEAAPIDFAKSLLDPILSLGDFKGKQGETQFVYSAGQRMLFLGLGQKEKASSEVLRRAFSQAVKQVLAKRLKSTHFFVPLQSSLSREETLHGVV